MIKKLECYFRGIKMHTLKLNNGHIIKYTLKQNNKIDMSIIIQKLTSLSENLYHENIDNVNASYELDKMLDDLIEFN